MEVAYGPALPLTPGGYHISPALLESGSPLLPDFYERIMGGLQTTVDGLRRSDGEKLSEYETILNELKDMEDIIYDNRS